MKCLFHHVLSVNIHHVLSVSIHHVLLFLKLDRSLVLGRVAGHRE
jgi:hypothetical protein